MKFHGAKTLLAGICLVIGTGLCAESESGKQIDQMMEKKAAMPAASGNPQHSPLEPLMCDTAGVTAGGMDLVSYRQSGGPVPGNPEFSSEIMGDTYVFADQANLDVFEVDPLRYLPAYGGFCAMTLALGRVTCPDVMNYKIEDDRLLFFEVTGFTNGQTLWETDPLGFRTKADLNYMRFSKH